MIQRIFAENATAKLTNDPEVVGLCVGGSWLSNDMDAFSDLDLILITRSRISGDKELMLNYAAKLGNLLSGFTGEHVGEPRLLICLYDDPLLHVDIKFLTIDEFNHRIENPVILLDPSGALQKVLEQTKPVPPATNFQWIEDRFWIWVHYATLKIGRGEYLEAFDFFGFLRMVVFGPLLHTSNGNLPRGVRKVEFLLNAKDLELLQRTIPQYQRQSLIDSLKDAILLYRQLRASLYDHQITFQTATEQRAVEYLEQVELGAPQ